MLCKHLNASRKKLKWSDFPKPNSVAHKSWGRGRVRGCSQAGIGMSQAGCIGSEREWGWQCRFKRHTSISLSFANTAAQCYTQQSATLLSIQILIVCVAGREYSWNLSLCFILTAQQSRKKDHGPTCRPKRCLVVERSAHSLCIANPSLSASITHERLRARQARQSAGETSSRLLLLVGWCDP